MTRLLAADGQKFDDGSSDGYASDLEALARGNYFRGRFAKACEFQAELVLHLAETTPEGHWRRSVAAAWATVYQKVAALDEEKQKVALKAAEIARHAERYSNTGQWDQAIPLCREVVTTWKSVAGTDDAYYAGALNLYGMALYNACRHEEAVAAFREVVKVEEALFGEVHPYIATVLTPMSMAMTELERFEEAEEVMNRALKIRQTTLGPEHLDTAISICNFADLELKKGNPKQAERQVRKALSIVSRVRNYHLVETVFLSKLATCLARQNDLKGASAVYAAIMPKFEIQTRALPGTAAARIVEDYAGLLRERSEIQKAELYESWARSLREKGWGVAMPDELRTLR